MKDENIDQLRHLSRKLLRELGILQLNKIQTKKTPQHWHALIEISKEPDATISKLGHALLLSISATSRIVNALLKDGLVNYKNGIDKREKYFYLTDKGQTEIDNIDEFSNIRIKGAFEYLNKQDQAQIISAIQKYGDALEKSRFLREQIKILTLSTSRTIRKQIVNMIETIQKDEFSIPITEEINSCILRAEEDFYYNNSYNFWYAIDNNGTIIGSIGLKKIDDQNAEIKKFFVDKKYRGKGIAQKLMNTLVKTAFKHKFHNLYLGTVGSLQAAQRFYEKYGFSHITKQQLPNEFEICHLDTVFFQTKINMVFDRLSKILE